MLEPYRKPTIAETNCERAYLDRLRLANSTHIEQRQVLSENTSLTSWRSQHNSQCYNGEICSPYSLKEMPVLGPEAQTALLLSTLAGLSTGIGGCIAVSQPENLQGADLVLYACS